MRIAMLSPIAWRTPPRHYGPWENVVSLLTEGLVRRGLEVTLFATRDSRTRARLVGVCPRGYEEDGEILPKVWECLHISELFERGDDFDLIHNHFDFLPLTYMGMTSTPVLTTIHGFSSPKILPVYKKYNGRAYYVSISNADRSPELDYIATVHHGIDLKQFVFRPHPEGYLLFFGRIHHDKGTKEAVEIAKRTGRKLILAGIIQDETYFEREIKPHLDGRNILYVGSAGPRKRNKLLGGAFTLLHPIQFEEPFGLSVVEAMACGTPVIAFNRGSMPEVVSHGRTGFLVSTIEEAAEKVNDINGLDRAECRRWVEEHFTVDRMVEGYLEVYRKILEGHKRQDQGPWGHVECLADEPAQEVNRILLHPGEGLPFRRVDAGSSHWYIVRGHARILRDGQEFLLRPGESLDFPHGSHHQIMNVGRDDVVFIEIRRGTASG